MNPIDESDRCGECGQLPELIEEAAVNPLSGDEWTWMLVQRRMEEESPGAEA